MTYDHHITGGEEMGIANLFKRWNENTNKLEQELAQAHDRIDELEAQNVELQTRIVEQQDYISAIQSPYID